MSLSKLKLDNLSQTEIQTVLADAWLNTNFNGVKYWNPLTNFPAVCEDNPEYYLTWLMSRPEYFQFICKEILGVTIYPTQGVILQTLWNHKFPMLIASRGWGKSFILGLYSLLRLILLPGRKIVIAGAAFRQSKIIFEYMETIWNNAPLLRSMCGGHSKEQGPFHGTDMYVFRVGRSIAKAIPIGCLTPDSLVTTDKGISIIENLRLDAEKQMVWGNGKFRKVGFFFDSGITDAIRVTTSCGYEYCGTPNHKMRILRDGESIWCRTDEMVEGDEILIDNNMRWPDIESSLSVKECYELGCHYKIDEIFSSSESQVRYWMKGLYNTYGEISDSEIIFNTYDRAANKKLQYVFLHWGIVSKLVEDKLVICGHSLTNFCDMIYFSLRSPNRGQISDKIISIEKTIQQPMYDINIPDGNEYCANGFYSHNTGDKIRGIRSNDTIVDEMASVSREIFETVIGGFAAVSASPIDSMQRKATQRLADFLKVKLPDAHNIEDSESNQTVISGTAHYAFNHFADYHTRWHKIISTGDKKEEMAQAFNGQAPKGLKAKDFAIFRMPIELVPDGFMEEAQVARSKATVASDVYLREYGAVFAKDSNGFFRRTLIETCVASETNNVCDSQRRPIVYTPMLRGNPQNKYIIAVDPASEVDNFAIVIVELCETYRKIVYTWTTNKKDFRERVSAGLVSENNFYAFAARKIRELIKAFPCTHVMMDSQGGGQAVLEALHDKDKLKDGEQLIWEMIVPGDPKSTDGERGDHIVELVNFADSAWVSEANHGLKKDLEDKVCLFPGIDAVEVAKAMFESDGLYDTMEDCIYEIEELKNELSIIVMVKTPTGKDKWDTPDTKIPGSKKGAVTKDRYSALLMANMAARQYLHTKPRVEHNTEAGWMHDYDAKMQGPSYQGPTWASDILNDLYD